MLPVETADDAVNGEPRSGQLFLPEVVGQIAEIGRASCRERVWLKV
jgi:hypothetical protein